MLRAIVDFVLMLMAFAMLRSVISAVSKAVSGGPARRDVPTGGELRRDPVCGTFVPVAGSLHKNANGITQYFCSQSCLDRFRPA